MAGKEAIAVILDVGKSMHTPSLDDPSIRRLDVALDFIKTFLTQKVLFNKQHEPSLVLMGSDEGEDGGDLLAFRPVGKVDMEFIKGLEDIRTARASKLEGGDIFKALSSSCDMLDDFVKKKKYEKKIFMFTDGNGATKCNETKARDVGRKCRNTDTKINIIGLDFGEEDDEDNTYNRTDAQAKNLELLNIFSENAECKIFPSSLALTIQKQFRSRFVRAVAKFKGPLEITPDLQINVLSYGKIVEEKFPTAKKASVPAGKDKSLSQGKVTYNRESYLHDDPDQNTVDAENKIKGYYYGKQLVPIPDVLADKLKYTSQKCMKLLCFADKKSVPRHFFMGSVDMVIPHDDENDKKALSAIIRALYELDKVAIIRYCYRDNLAPKLACLIPHIGANYECLWMNILPTVEDIRDYQFNSLKEATGQQEKVIGDFIDILDLMKCEDDDEEAEGLKPPNTYNPTLHYYYQCLVHRAFNEDDKLPPLDPTIANYVRPDKKMFDKAKLNIENIEKTFSLKENPKKDKNKAKMFWSQMLAEAAKKMETESTEQSETASVAAGKEEKDLDIDKDIVRKISQATPVVDFRRMINEKAEDLTNSAIEQMTKLIEKLIEESFQGNFYERALECLQELRKGCVQEDEAPAFNDFLELLKDRFANSKHQKFWQKVINHGVTLIDGNETDSSVVTIEEAKKFLLEEDKVVQQKQEQQEAEDLLADIE